MVDLGTMEALTCLTCSSVSRYNPPAVRDGSILRSLRCFLMVLELKPNSKASLLILTNVILLLLFSLIGGLTDGESFRSALFINTIKREILNKKRSFFYLNSRMDYKTSFSWFITISKNLLDFTRALPIGFYEKLHRNGSQTKARILL